MKKKVINMEMVKMFDAIEIEKETGIDVFDCLSHRNFCNDSAIPWWVEDDDENKENFHKINSYLLAHGAVLGEKVWIDVTW